MALEVQQSICILCGEFRIADITGTYDVTTNPGGYGTPNPDFGDTTPYTVDLYPPKATVPAYTLDLLSNPPDPDAKGHYNYVVTAADLGYKEQVLSGAWKVVVTHGATVTKRWILATGEIEARVTKCICCDCASHTQLHLDLVAIERLFRCYKVEKAQAMMEQLYRDTDECCGCSDC